MANADPWETRSQDEIDGIRWPAPAPITPEDEAILRQMAINIGRNIGRQRELIIAGILSASAKGEE